MRRYCHGGSDCRVGAAPLWTLEQGLGEPFTPEAAAAWATLYYVEPQKSLGMEGRGYGFAPEKTFPHEEVSWQYVDPGPGTDDRTV